MHSNKSKFANAHTEKDRKVPEGTLIILPYGTRFGVTEHNNIN